MDGYNYDDGGGWDGGLGWGSGKRVQSRRENGWCVEYKIPYQTLRFSPQEKYTWGINVIRYISRKKEDVYWRMVPLEQSGWPSHFGHLEGIEQIIPSKPLEIMPYVVGPIHLYFPIMDPLAAIYSAIWGLICATGLTSSLSLNATVNPDFGQVEADPAVLNLSVFETFFEERRPFFRRWCREFPNAYPAFSIPVALASSPASIASPVAPGWWTGQIFTTIFRSS